MKSLRRVFPVPSGARLAAKLGKRKIVVLMGGTSAERKISLLTGQAVLRALQTWKLSVTGVDIKSARRLFRLAAQKPDVAMLCLHGPGGEDGSVQGVLEWAGIPYTGSGILASALAMNKSRSKQIFKTSGLPTAPWVLLDQPAAVLPKSLKLPVVVKPNQQGSAIGVSMVSHAQEWPSAFQQARRYGNEVLVEKFCPGKELSVGILSGRPLPIVEIIPKNAFYDYEAKYVSGMSDHIIPARLAPAQTRLAQQLALAAYQALGCRGICRVDLIMSPADQFTVLEVNTTPGMTSTSLIPDEARHAGIPFETLLLILLLEALGEKWSA